MQSTGHIAKALTKQGVSEQSATRPPVMPPNGQDSAASTDPDLATIIAAWPTLPAAMKAGVVALVKAAAQ
ncbi:MAG TPA: hypothetical protein VK157_14065 [Phycisphaerales bacterium]|nr:hypothetical protein [Phycisphaerales bacterium]